MKGKISVENNNDIVAFCIWMLYSFSIKRARAVATVSTFLSRIHFLQKAHAIVCVRFSLSSHPIIFHECACECVIRAHCNRVVDFMCFNIIYAGGKIKLWAPEPRRKIDISSTNLPK